MSKSLASRTIPRNHLASSIQKKQGEIDLLCLPNGAQIELGRSSEQHGGPSFGLICVTDEIYNQDWEAPIRYDYYANSIEKKNEKNETCPSQREQVRKSKKDHRVG